MHSRVISRDFETFDGTISLFSKHKSGKNFRTKNEEKRGKRIPLSQASLRIYEIIGAAIQKYRESRRSDAGSNPGYPNRAETNFFHDSNKKGPLHSIKCLLHVHFEKQKPSFSFLVLKRMKEFMSQD